MVTSASAMIFPSSSSRPFTSTSLPPFGVYRKLCLEANGVVFTADETATVIKYLHSDPFFIF
jgi:hypothetical protein